jgi:hypothetical protein
LLLIRERSTPNSLGDGNGNFEHASTSFSQ